MPADKNESDIRNVPAEKDSGHIKDNDEADHPGLKKLSPNPNPRANENLTGSENVADEGEKTNEVGSEITDGESG